MTPVVCRRVVLVTLFLFCFISFATTGAQAARVGPINGANAPSIEVEISRHENMNGSAAADDHDLSTDDTDLVTIDYTPAKKKPPIHN